MKGAIRDVKDYPKPGIVYRDITPLLKDARLFGSCIGELARRLEALDVDCIAGIESRGFIIGAALAVKMGKGFVPIRKKGKLPHKKAEVSYVLEYGTATIEMHRDAVGAGQRVAIVDDVLATGGTAVAAAKLVEGTGGKVAVFAFVIEVSQLNGRGKLDGQTISLIRY